MESAYLTPKMPVLHSSQKNRIGLRKLSEGRMWYRQYEFATKDLKICKFHMKLKSL